MSDFLIFVYVCFLILRVIGWPSAIVAIPWLVCLVPAIVVALVWIIIFLVALVLAIKK